MVLVHGDIQTVVRLRSSIPLRLTSGLLAVRQSWELAWDLCYILWVCSRCLKDAALLNKYTRRGGDWKSCGYAKTWIYLQWKNKFYRRFNLLVLALSLRQWGRPLLYRTWCCAAIWRHPISFHSIEFLCWTFRSAKHLSAWRGVFCSTAPPLHCLWQVRTSSDRNTFGRDCSSQSQSSADCRLL